MAYKQPWTTPHPSPVSPGLRHVTKWNLDFTIYARPLAGVEDSGTIARDAAAPLRPPPAGALHPFPANHSQAVGGVQT